jgi:hypothetical protein
MRARDQRQHRISRRSLVPLRRITWSVRKYTGGSGKGARTRRTKADVAPRGKPSLGRDGYPSPS